MAVIKLNELAGLCPHKSAYVGRFTRLMDVISHPICAKVLAGCHSSLFYPPVSVYNWLLPALPMVAYLLKFKHHFAVDNRIDHRAAQFTDAYRLLTATIKFAGDQLFTIDTYPFCSGALPDNWNPATGHPVMAAGGSFNVLIKIRRFFHTVVA